MIALLGGEDMERTRSRMSDIERGRIAGGGWSSDDAGVNGSGVGMMGTMGEGVNLDDPENRDREWEFLEGLFTGDNNGGGRAEGTTSRITSRG